MANRTTRTPKKDAEFFAALASGQPIGKAGEAAGYPRSSLYEWREADPEFARQWADADERAIERMEEEADRRAIEGIDKPVHYQGDRVDVIREYSDTLLIFRLKAKRPNVYRERSHLDIDQTVTNKVMQDQPLTDEQWIAKYGARPDAQANGHLNGHGHGSNGKAPNGKG